MADARFTFVKTAAPGARAGATEFGVPASVTLAQAILESGWGRSHIGAANNYFGIKAFARGNRVDVGPIATGFVTVPTKEVLNGHVVTVQARFRRYRTLADSMRDHGLFLRANSRYKPAFAHSSEPDAFARALQQAGYATDPHYADKLISLMRTFNLYQFDSAGTNGGANGQVKPTPRPAPEPTMLASVAALQRDLNAQLAALGAPERLAVDGRWDAHTDLAFRRVCRVLGLEARRGPRTYRIIAGAAAQRTPEEVQRATTDGAAYEQRLRAHFAHADDAGGAGGAGHAPAPGRPAIVGGKSLATKERTRAYVAALQRDLNTLMAHLGSPERLAVDGDWGSHTDRAFRRACRILGLEPKRGVRTFRILSGAIEQRTAAETERAAADGSAYERKLRVHFHTQQRQPLTPDPEPTPTPTPTPTPQPAGRPRTFRLQSPNLQGSDIKAFQRVLNERFRRWGVSKRVDEDGEYGSITRLATRQVCHGLGLAKQDYPGGITPEMRSRIRTPSRRSPEELALAKRRRTWLEKLRRQHEGGGAELALAYARKHLGVKETPENRGPLVDKWNSATRTPLGSAWCGNFMNACLMNAGFPAEWWMAGCALIEGHARTGQGGWEWTSTPRPGDLALFTVNGAPNHVGMVESVEGATVITIEGNTHPDDGPGAYGVFRRHHPASVPRGYARPPYGR